MSQRRASRRTTATIRPLAPYEPAPSPHASRDEPAEPQAWPSPARPRHLGNQLTLPLRGEPAPETPQLSWLEAGCARQRPSDAELIQLVTAVVELAAGRRSAHALRDRLSEPLRQRLLGDPQPWLGRQFVITRVYCDRQGPHVLHVNATVHERIRRAAFATSTCLTPLGRSAWQVSEFYLLTPALRAQTPNAA